MKLRFRFVGDFYHYEIWVNIISNTESVWKWISKYVDVSNAENPPLLLFASLYEYFKKRNYAGSLRCFTFFWVICFVFSSLVFALFLFLPLFPSSFSLPSPPLPTSFHLTRALTKLKKICIGQNWQGLSKLFRSVVKLIDSKVI